MLKPFTPEGRFESGLDPIVEGKRWAFVAVLGEANPARLGVAVAGEPGYYPIPEFWCHADDYGVMRAHADALNAERGLDLRSAAQIVASTMRRPGW
jgi:hypothetical protein